MNNNDTLQHLEAKSFLADVFDYDYRKKSHRSMAAKILQIVDVDNNQLYHLIRFKQFFELPNFIEISGCPSCCTKSLNSLQPSSNHLGSHTHSFGDQRRER